MKITVITYLEKESVQEHDIVVDQVAESLKWKGHEVSILGVHGDVRKLIAGLRRRGPDLVFNLMEMFDNNVFGDIGVAGLLDLLAVPHTGGGAGEFYLQQDKALAKKLLSYEGIAYPDFAVFSESAGLETGGRLRMPLFVKPLRTDASIGIDGGALVHNSQDMIERVQTIHRKVHDAALVEEYIDGREIYVGVVGNAQPTAFPPIEMDFSRMPEGVPHIVDRKAKWDEKSPEYKGTKAVVAELPDDLRARLEEAAKKAFLALRVRDYGRIDLRLTPSGDIYVIEVNASCYLERGSEFAAAAAAAGVEYPELIERIVNCASERWGIQRK